MTAILDYPQPASVFTPEPPCCPMCGDELETDGDHTEPMFLDCECEVAS